MVAATAASGSRRQSPASTTHGLHEQKVSAAFQAQRLTAVPSDLLTLKNLVRIDLSMNQITRFPGKFVAAEMLRLEVLLLQDNLLYVLEDILVLGSAPRLRELDLQRNPLRLQNNRMYLLEALFSEPGSDESLLVMVQKDEQLKFHDGVAASDENSRTRLPDRKQSKSNKRAVTKMRAPRHSSMKYRAKLPRKRGFPMLQRLNGEWITDSEVKDVETECGYAIEYFHPTAQVQDDKSNRELKLSKKGKAFRPQPAGSESEKGSTSRRFDGSRMTIKQMLKNEARSVGIPVARVIQRIQINAENGDEVELHEEGRDEEQVSSLAQHRLSQNQNQNTRKIGGFQRSLPDTTQSKSLGGTSDGGNNTTSELDDKDEEQSIIHRLFQPSTGVVTEAQTHPFNSQDQKVNLTAKLPSDDDDDEDDKEEELEPWNYPISTFDTLNSEERQYVRYKSKQVGSTIERDDHFFDSSVFLDCVAQAERSRRLTVRAVDLLSQQHRDENGGLSSSHKQLFGSQSTPSFPTCSAASALVDSMNAKFTKQLDRATYEKTLAFQEKQLSVDSLHIQAAVGDYYQSEHVLQKQRNNEVLSAQTTSANHQHHSSAAPHSAIESTIDDSLSKLKLRNAVDLANTLLDPKQQKRMLQTLIDADEKVIEEERVAQEQTAHKYRLHLINARSYTPHDNKQIEELVRKVNNTSESPWQRRNWKAIEMRQQQQQQQQLSELDHLSSSKQLQSSSSPSPKKASINSKLRGPVAASTIGAQISGGPVDFAKPEVSCRFHSIETVEKAAQDALPGVNSHDLLVRCAEIRQHADKHMKALHLHRDQFLEDETEWERMRQDPTNFVRKHLKRRLYQHTQEVQIGSTQFFYSSLFN